MVTFNLLPYAGQTIRIQFASVSDGLKATNFRIDDVSVQAVVAVAVTLTSLAINGPSSVAEGNTAQYAATAVFSDGSTQTVTPSWSVNSTAASINSSSGLLTAGSVSSDTTVTVSASYMIGGVTRSASQNVTIINLQQPVAPVITSAGTASGTVNQPFSYQITATNSPTSYGASGLPGGLSVNSGTGLILGTPTTSGTSNVTVTATNVGGTGSKTVTITIATVAPAAPVITSAGTASGTVNQSFSYQITATNSPTSYGASGLPDGLSVNTSNGLISGTPSVSETYYATVTATNATGIGSAVVTITIAPTVPPIDGTLTASANSGQVSLNWSGFTDTGGIASYKLVYSTTSTPSSCSAGTEIYSGTGSSYAHTGLTNNTTYFYRLCATDNAGNISSGTTVIAIPSADVITLATQSSQYWAIAVDSANVYWTDVGNNAIMKISKNGGIATTLASGSPSAKVITVYGNYVYWAESTNASTGSGYIKMISVDGGTVYTVASSNTWAYYNGIRGLAVDSSGIYWAVSGNNSSGTNGAIMKLSGVPVDNPTLLAQTAPTTLASGLINAIGLAIDSNDVYWIEPYTAVKKINKNGGSVTILTSSSVEYIGIAVDATNVYFGVWNGNIYKVPLGGGSSTNLGGGMASGFIAVDSDYVYYTNFWGEMVGKVAKYGVGSSILYSGDGNGGSWGIAVDDTAVYWTACPTCIAPSMGAVKKITINQDSVNSYNLTVNKSGTGTGGITSSPAGINCGSNCGASFNTGAVVSLTATPDNGSTFTGWSGSGCSGAGTCIITMNAGTAVTATFTANQDPVDSYALTVNKSGTGTGGITSSPAGINCGSNCGASFNSGAVVSLTATPDTGSTFTGWSGSGCSGAGFCTITMNADTGVTATFTAETNYTYTVSPTTKSFKATGGKLTVKVKGIGQNCPAPLVTINDAWLSQSGAISWKKNAGTVKIVLQKNTSSQNRTSVIWIGGNAITIEETGAQCQLTAVKSSFKKFTNGGGTGSLDVVVSPQDCAWNVSTISDWIHLDTSAGTGNGNVVFYVDTNATGKNRTGKIDASLATNVKKKKTLSLKQNK